MSLDNILLIPGLGEEYSASRYAGAWAVKQPWLDGNTVLDQRTGLGTPRHPEPRRCLSFNGTDQYGWIPIAPVTEFPFALFGWARVSAVGVDNLCGISASSSSVMYFNLRVDEGDRVGVSRRNTTEFVSDISMPLLENQWISYVVVFTSATSATLYRNGILAGELLGLDAVNVGSSFNRFHLACRAEAGPTVYLEGKAMHTGFLRRAATLADAQTFHATGIIPDAEVLLPLDGNSTTVAHNIGTSNATYPEATIVNGAAGMLYEGRDVPFSRQNEVGFSERKNLLTNTSTLNVTPWSGSVRDTAVLQPDGGWKLVGFSDAAGVRLSQQQECSPLTTYTAQVEVRAEGSDIGKAFTLMLIRSGLTTSVFEQTVVNLTADYQLITVTWTGLADTEGYQIRFNFPTGGADAPIVRNPMVNQGNTATSYQRIGSNPGNDVRIPALLSDPTKSAATDTITYTGKAHFDASLEQSNCLTFDGVDDYVLGDALPEMSINLDWSGHFRLKVDSSGSFVVLNNIINTNDRVAISTTGASLRFGLWNGTTWVATRNGTVVIGQWHLIEFSYQSGILTATIDGVPLDTSLTPISTSIGGFSLGARPQGDFLFNGSICDFQVDGVIHLPMSEGAGDFVHDTIGNRAYPIVNGQASNWETKQDVYNYNITKGATVVDIVPDGEKIDALFESDEQGAVYDAYDLSTLFQDPAGTQPVTASGQTVGLHLDKSKGLVLGPELAVAKQINGVAIGGPSFTSYNLAPVVSGRFYQFQATVSDYSGTDTVGLVQVGTSITNSNITALRTSNGSIAVLGFATATGNLQLFTRSENTCNFTNISVRELPGNHRYQTSAPSRPQYTEDGNLRYLLYDGIDDFMETNAVDFTGTNKMTVWWGGRKLSDAVRATVMELGTSWTSNDGAFAIEAPLVDASLGGYRFVSRGTSSRDIQISSGYPAPITNVLTQVSDITLPSLVARINGVQVGSNSASQGAGNYGNYKLYFGRRGGTTLPANIREYMTIIRGAETELRTIETIENLVARKTGIAEPHYEDKLRVPASQTNLGFDSLGNPLTNPAIVGHNGAETEINFSSVDNSWPEQYSIPGADLPNYTFDGDPGDISLGIDTATREARFKLER